MTCGRAEEKLHASLTSVKAPWIIFETPIITSHENRASNLKRLPLLGVTIAAHAEKHSKS